MHFQSCAENSKGGISCYLVVFILFLFASDVSPDIQYRAPASCDWAPMNSNEVSVSCGIQTVVGAGVLATNFSLIQADYTSVLLVNCDPVFFESSLAPGSFSHLEDLKALYITHCKLREIPQDTFRGLTELRNLTVRSFNSDWGAFDMELRPGSFSDLGQVEILDLGFNKISRLTGDFLCGLNSLKVLNLTNNDLMDIMPDGGYHKNCVSDVMELDVSFNKIAKIDGFSLQSFRSLRSLTLMGSGLQEVEESSLNGLEKLQVLDLSSNKLTTLPAYTFDDCRDLLELYLQNNSISTFPAVVFSKLEQLLVLNLSYNQLTTEYCTSATFSNMIRLVILDLSHNQLRFLNSSAFQAQYSLQMLYLSHNDIVIIADNTFSALYNLHTLDLSYNEIKILDTYTLNGLYVMSLLQLSYNDLYSIHPDAFKNCSSLQDLSLQGNKLNHVPFALRALQFLKTLDLSDNMISNLENSTLQHLRQLQVLDLSYNNIGNISRGTFLHMDSLMSFDLSKNAIQGIQHGTFEDTPVLHDINLSENDMDDINGLFLNMKTLKSLNVSHNVISWFDYAFIPLDLLELDMNTNQITILGNYYELEASLLLEYLDVSFNQIEDLTRSSFPNRIQFINISNNNVRILSPYTFSVKSALVKADLSNNSLVTLDLNTFRLSPQITTNVSDFYIAGNPFYCDCKMEWLQKMVANRESSQARIADFDKVMCKVTFTRYGEYVPLSETSVADFLCGYRSHCFALCHCCDFDACDCEMVCPDNCTCYSDQTWNTNIVDCSNREYTSMPPTIPMDVTDLYLDGNDIYQLTSHTFIGRKNMRIIYLNNSNIHAIHNRTFNGLQSLNVLHLENNELSALHGFEFELLIHLKELYLSNNKISFITNTTFQNLRALEILHLDHNFITEFHVWNLKWNSLLKRAKLGYNPWICNCDYLRSYHEWLRSSSGIVHDVETIQCRRNQSFGPYVVEFDSATSCSNKSSTLLQTVLSEKYMPYVIGVPIVLLILIVLIVLGCIYQKETRVFLSNRCGINFFKENPPPNPEKLFDAFVSYTKNDELFVSQTLLPEMEHGSPSYRVCLRERDLPESDFVTESISQAIECSHRTIVVLSEQFLQTDTCHFVVENAYRESLYNGVHKLIIVTIDKDAMDIFHLESKISLEDTPVLRWGERQFWEKLKCSMPKGQGPVPRKSSKSSTATKLHHQSLSCFNSVRLV